MFLLESDCCHVCNENGVFYEVCKQEKGSLKNHQFALKKMINPISIYTQDCTLVVK